MDATSALLAKLDCLDHSIQRIERLLSYSYGRPKREVAGYDPAALPFVRLLELTPEAPRRFDFLAVLGRGAVRGHISNLGDAPVNLYFERVKSAAESAQRVGPYQLAPQTTLELSWVLEALELEADADAVVQILAQ